MLDSLQNQNQQNDVRIFLHTQQNDVHIWAEKQVKSRIRPFFLVFSQIGAEKRAKSE